jgi:hypothetical protein
LAWYDWVVDALNTAFDWFKDFVRWAEAQFKEGFKTLGEFFADVKDWILNELLNFRDVLFAFPYDLRYVLEDFGSMIRELAAGDIRRAVMYAGAIVTNLESYIRDVARGVATVVEKTVNYVEQTIVKNVYETNQYITQVVGASKEWVLEQLGKLNIPTPQDIADYVSTQLNNFKGWVSGWFTGQLDEFRKGFEEGLEEELKGGVA